MEISVLSLVDVVILMSNLWEESKASLFVDSSEQNAMACSLTFFSDNDRELFKRGKRSTVGAVYTTDGGAVKVFNGQMKVVSQTFNQLTQEDFQGLYNMMLHIQKALPPPQGVSSKEVLEENDD